MRILVLAATVAMSLSARAPQPAPSSERSIVVCLEEGSDIRVRGMAIPLASELFAGIGLRVVWPRDDRRCFDETGAILIRLVYESKSKEKPHAFGYAFPYGGRRRIVIFYDRVERAAGESRAPCLLAYVLAHEITHVLQESDRHSEAGIMKAVWNGEDLYAMDRRELHFTPMDVFMIDHGLKRR